jgi:hypothetical protein
MSKQSYKTYSKDDIKLEIDNRIFPQKFMILKNPNGFNNIFEFGLRQLNSYSYHFRFYQTNVINGSYVDVSAEALDLVGISVRKVSSVNSASDVNSFIEIWRQFRTMPQFFTNLYRYNDNFLEYTQAEMLFKQIQQKWGNKNISWQYIPSEDKIVLDNACWRNVSSVVICFIPNFNIDDEDEEWEMWDEEFEFLIQMILSELYIREGISKSHSITMNVDTNYQLLIDTGKEMRTNLIADWESSSIYRSARRF